jgi:hypothetical protein
MRKPTTPVRAWGTALAITATLLAGCATPPPQKDYSAFKQAKPASILVLPPVNLSPDVNATFSMLSHATLPLAESGYYVMPVALVNETFKQNGLANPPEMHEAPLSKLREIFGADAAMYIQVTRYGTTYTVLNSAAVVSASARLVDLRTGTELWTGTATASNADNNNQGGLAGMLISALVKQVMNNLTDASHSVANVTSMQLLSAGMPNGLLYGPRSPKHGQEGPR